MSTNAKAAGDLVWKDPPPPHGQRTPWDEIANALRQRPGQWAIISEGRRSSQASFIKHARIAAFRPAGSFDARSVSIGNGTIRIYARFVGES